MTAAAPFHQIPYAARELVFVDTETSSLSEDTGDILELAAKRLTPDLQELKGVVHRKCLMDHPETASPEALKVNGYDAAIWQREGYPVRIALVELTQLVTDEVLWVGSNPIFDVLFVKEACRRERLSFPRTRYTIDTASLAFPLVRAGTIDRMGLEPLCKLYGVSNDGQHTAMADVNRTIAIFGKLLGITPSWRVLA